MKIKIFSFFAGAGFLDLGFETTGYEVVLVNEYQEPFLAAYKHVRRKLGIGEPQYGYYPNSIEKFLQPIQEARLKNLVHEAKAGSDYVGFIGGPPCPDFSVGGKNKGKDGINGKLSKVYVDLICSQQPDFFLFENVKGLWRTKRHREFYDELKSTLEKSGYLLSDSLVNSIEYGVAQDRDRVILVGFHKNIFDSPLTYPVFKPLSFSWRKYASFKKEEVFSYNWIDVTPFNEDAVLPFPNGIPEELTVQHWFEKNKVFDHPNAKHCFTPRAGLVRFKSIPEGDVSKKSFKRLHRWRYSPTAAYGNNEVHLHPYKPRRISVSEALAIQSLPHQFELPPEMTLSNMFKTIGNGVPYLLAKAVAQTIGDFLEDVHAYANTVGYCQSYSQVTKEPSLQLY